MRNVGRAKRKIRALIAGSRVPEDPLHADNTLEWLLRLEPDAGDALYQHCLGGHYFRHWFLHVSRSIAPRVRTDACGMSSSRVSVAVCGSWVAADTERSSCLGDLGSETCLYAVFECPEGHGTASHQRQRP